MNTLRKGKKLVCIILAIIFSLGLFACETPNETPDDVGSIDILSPNGFYVSFIDVGQGDSALINLPNGKKIMIDCGSRMDFATGSIKSFLQKAKVDKIDYLILTHPDEDHVGGALSLINDISVGQLFVPLVYSRELFPVYNSVINLCEEKQIPTFVSQRSVIEKGEDFSVSILAPAKWSDNQSSYRDFNLAENPTETQTNDISAVVFIEYKGISFLFTGDISSKQEQKILANYQNGIYTNEFSKQGANINLSEIDFLKVSHHGSADSSSEQFLNLLKPSNAVISVGGDNIFGHPSTSVLNRIINANQNCNVLRTDVKGSIIVTVNDNGQYSVNFDK